MKKFLAVAISLMMVLSLSAFAANLEIDIDSLKTDATPWVGVHDGANFDGNTIQIMSPHHITFPSIQRLSLNTAQVLMLRTQALIR